MKLALLFFLAFPVVAFAYPPTHDISDIPAAQDEAKQRQLPIAFLGVVPGVLDQASPNYNSNAELAQMALKSLEGRAVVITFNGLTMAGVPGMVHAQFHIADDGQLTGGGAWIVPKIVFTDPGVTKILGRVSHTQVAAGRESPIDNAFASIAKDPDALKPAPPDVASVANQNGAETPDAETEEAPQFGSYEWEAQVFADRWPFFLAGFAIFIVALIAWAAKNL